MPGPPEQGPEHYPGQELERDRVAADEEIAVETDLRTIAQRVLIIPDDGRRFLAMLARRWGWNMEVLTARDRAMHNAFTDLLLIAGILDTDDPVTRFFDAIRPEVVRKHRDYLRRMAEQTTEQEVVIPGEYQNIPDEREEHARERDILLQRIDELEGHHEQA